MRIEDILRRRIERHHLGDRKAADPAGAARRIGGLHAQVTSSAQASAALRLAVEPDLEDALWRERSLTVLLLPAFDPYVVGSLRRLETVSSGPKSAVSRPQGWISPTLVVNGRIDGVWEAGDGHPVVTPFTALSAATRRALPEGTVVR